MSQGAEIILHFLRRIQKSEYIRQNQLVAGLNPPPSYKVLIGGNLRSDFALIEDR